MVSLGDAGLASARPRYGSSRRVVARGCCRLHGRAAGGAEQVFAEFEWKPLAAASIAQVYGATRSGQRVGVKVQRPKVAETVARNTQAMLTLGRFVQRRTAIGLRMDVLAFVHEFTDAVREELDITHEARAEERIRANRVDDKGIGIPRVHMDLCTRRLIVFEEVHDRPVSDTVALAAWPYHGRSWPTASRPAASVRSCATARFTLTPTRETSCWTKTGRSICWTSDRPASSTPDRT